MFIKCRRRRQHRCCCFRFAFVVVLACGVGALVYSRLLWSLAARSLVRLHICGCCYCSCAGACPFRMLRLLLNSLAGVRCTICTVLNLITNSPVHCQYFLISHSICGMQHANIVIHTRSYGCCTFIAACWQQLLSIKFLSCASETEVKQSLRILQSVLPQPQSLVSSFSLHFLWCSFQAINRSIVKMILHVFPSDFYMKWAVLAICACGEFHFEYSKFFVLLFVIK